jgi:hypothetical protein
MHQLAVSEVGRVKRIKLVFCDPDGGLRIRAYLDGGDSRGSWCEDCALRLARLGNLLIHLQDRFCIRALPWRATFPAFHAEKVTNDCHDQKLSGYRDDGLHEWLR